MFSDFIGRSSRTIMLLLFYTVFLVLIIRESPAFQLPDEPRMYPQRGDVTVDAHSDLTLGCRGVEPMDWTFRDDFNSQYYNSARIHINSTVNEEEVSLKYESILTVYNVSRRNIGFYYCYARAADHNTARRSTRIYVYVRDDNDVSVITSKGSYSVDINWLGLIPCRPTSPDISIKLECRSLVHEYITLTVHPDNYTGARQIKVSFHPYSGFQLQSVLVSNYINYCECVFTRSKKEISRVHFTQIDLVFGFAYRFALTIGGPNTANVGDDITLQCAVLTSPYFPYYVHGFQWKIPNKRNTMITVYQPLKLKGSILLNATITIKNISVGNEGHYSAKFYNYKDSKYLFVNDKKTKNYCSPWIHDPSNGGEVQVNAGENTTLRCSGSRPVTWRPKDEKRTLYNYNQLNKTSGKYEAHLQIPALRYTDTGYYYCHENDSPSDHPFKSDKIYIFVKDENNLYVPHGGRDLYADPYTNVTVPCLPTSQDTDVSLSLMYTARDPVTGRYGPRKMIDSEIYRYDPREGFTVQAPGPGYLYATCTFTTGTIPAIHEIKFYVHGLGFLRHYVNRDPVITGPSEDLVFVGQTLELSCAVLVLYNVTDDALRWTSPSNVSVNEIIPKVKRSNLRSTKVLVSTLILDNMQTSDQGRYSCHLDNATVNKFISVYDEFDFEPTITIVHYNVAYVGQPFAAQCDVSVDHNVELLVLSWTTPNEALGRAKIMGTEYNTSIRNILGRRLLQIDNVTYDDGGNYTCSVSAFTNRRKHVTTNIIVKRGVIPRIVSRKLVKEEEMDVLVEGTVNLTCFAEGDPKPVITWMKDSSDIRSGGNINITSNNTQLTVRFVRKIDAGRYTCIALNPFGEDSRVVNLSVITEVGNGWYIVPIVCISILSATLVVLLIRRSYRTKKRRNAIIKGSVIRFKDGQIQYFNPLLNVAEQATLLPYDTKWEIPRNKVELGRNLGSGCFGLVVEATVSNFFEGEPERTVAVKMLHPHSNFMDLNMLISELKIMIHLGEHDNLVNLLGACTGNLGEKRLLVVLEYCRHGNLRNYLMENRCNFVNLIDADTELICFPEVDSLQVDDGAPCSSSEPPPAPPPRVCTLQLLHWALQAARGLEFLAAKQTLHGDLAARNLLLADNFIVKISDFGLSKTLSSGYYKKESQCPLPIKWMAIESIRDKTFSTQSDVWAFGVVLWELFSLARIPYAELEPDVSFYRKLESGYRLERPEYSTRELYQVMRECWSAQPQCRPSFASLARTLTDLLRDPSTLHVDAADDRTTPQRSSSAASVLTAEPGDCVALDIDVLTTTDTL